MGETSTKMDWIEANKLVSRHRCAECGAHLTILADPHERYKVLCAANHEHRGFEPTGSWTQQWKQGDPIPLEIANRLEKKFGGEQMATTELMKLDKPEIERRIRVAMKHFGFVVDQTGIARAPNPDEMLLLVEYCLAYGFDPILHEVCLYQGSPYPMIDGLRRKAHETGQYRGLKLDPITDKEFKKALGFAAGDIVFRATVKKVEEDGIIGEYERYDGVTQSEIQEMTTKIKDGQPYQTPRNPVIAKRAANIAQVRAERDGLRAAFSFQFPMQIATIEAEYHEVKTETSKPPAEQGKIAAAAHTEAPPKAKPKRDPNSIKSVQDYLDACKEDFGLGEKEALDEANASTKTDIVDPREAYRQVAAVRGE